MKKFLSFALLFLLTAPVALAGLPEPWQLNFQPPASLVKQDLDKFHNLLLIIITGICLFVLALLVYVCVRYSARRNPTPSKVSHNTALEIAWTAVPVLILVIIAIPSFDNLYRMNTIPEASITVKTTGYQWYWNYEYPDHGGFTFDAYMVPDQDLQPGQSRLLATDNEVVLPINTNIRILVTAADVLHSWAIPAFGVKMDAIPGRLNETWVNITKPGMYYGQCSEICGTGHGFMPIAVRAVTPEEFEVWVRTAQEKFASREAPQVFAAAR